MDALSSKKSLLFLLSISIILIAIIFSTDILKDKFWSVTGQTAFGLAKTEWAAGHITEAVHFWWYGVEFTIRDTIKRDRASRILMQSDKFLEQGKLTAALNSCYAASQIYNEEGAVTYHCMQIEQLIFGTPTPSQ